MFIMDNWISVEDQLPDTDDDVLVYIDHKNRSPVIEQSYWFRFQGGVRWSGHADSIITHWMPLPEPPEVSS